MFNSKKEINIYCDESCHLENDHQRAMVFGCIRCPKDKVQELSKELRALKQKHYIYKFAETKWKTVSKSKEAYYLELLDFFLNNSNIKFRAVVFQNKDLHKLDHDKFPNQTYQNWYYKMFYLTLNKVLDAHYKYNIYMDKQNANSSQIVNLEKRLSMRNSILKVQNVLSHESELIQLTDFLTGIVSYANRDAIKLPEANKTKIKLVETLKQKTELSLILPTPLKADKINIFMWEPDYYETQH